MTNEVRLPKLYDSDLQFVDIIHPISLGLELSLVPLSTASLTLPLGYEIPARSYVELFTLDGSAGMFRARAPEISYGEGTATTELEHAITEVGDWLIRAELNTTKTAKAAMTTVFSHYRGSKWQLGSVTALGTESYELNEDHTDVLSAMLSILDFVPDCMMTFDFDTTPWTINFQKVDAEGLVSEGRLSRNVLSASISYDDTDLCTRAYYKYSGTTWAVLNAGSAYQTEYGIVERTVETDDSDTQAQAKFKAQEYIRRNREPKVSIEISADDLYSVSGDDIDQLKLGRQYRLVLPDYGVTVTRHISGLSWDDIYENPMAVTVTLGEEDPTLWAYLRSKRKK